MENCNHCGRTRSRTLKGIPATIRSPRGLSRALRSSYFLSPPEIRVAVYQAPGRCLLLRKYLSSVAVIGAAVVMQTLPSVYGAGWDVG